MRPDCPGCLSFVRGIALISSSVTPSLENKPPCTTRNRLRPSFERIGEVCAALASQGRASVGAGFWVALISVAKGIDSKTSEKSLKVVSPLYFSFVSASKPDDDGSEQWWEQVSKARQSFVTPLIRTIHSIQAASFMVASVQSTPVGVQPLVCKGDEDNLKSVAASVDEIFDSEGDRKRYLGEHEASVISDLGEEASCALSFR